MDKNILSSLNADDYRLTFDHFTEGIQIAQMIFNDLGQPVDYIILDVNSAFEKHTGLKREQVAGKRVTDIIPVIEPEWFEKYGEAVKTGYQARFQMFSASLDRWFDISVYPLGRENKFQIVFSNITEKKRTAEALRLLEERFAYAFERNAASMCIVRLKDGVYLEVNKAWLVMFGWQRAEVLGRTSTQMGLWPRGEDREAIYEALRTKGYVRDRELSMKKQSGEECTGLLSADIITMNGEAVILSSILDITERKRAEKALRESEERQAYLLRLSDTLRDVEDPREIQRIACRLIKDQIGTETASYLELHFDKGYAEILSEDTDQSGPVFKETYKSDDYPACAALLKAGANLVIEDMMDTDVIPKDEAAKYLSRNVRAQISVPLIKSGRHVAYFTARQSTPRKWAPMEITLMKDTVERIWAGIERAKAEEALLESRSLLEEELSGIKTLQSASNELISGDSEHTIYLLLDTAKKIMRSDYASIQVLVTSEDGPGELRLLANRGFSDKAAKFWDRVSVSSTSICSEALRTNRRTIVQDVESCDFLSGTEDLEMFLQTGIHACQSTPLMTNGGKLTGMISTHWFKPHEPTERQFRLFDVLARQAADFIERTKAEEALRESEEKYRELVEYSPAWIFEADFRTGRYTSVNDAMCMITGYSREELLHMSPSQLLDEERRAKFQQRTKQWLSGERPDENVEYKVFSKDGREIYVLLNVKFTNDNHGNPLGASVIGYDITERKKAEERINHQNSILQAINGVYEKSVACATQQELGKECLKIINSLIGNEAGLIGEVGDDGFLYDIAYDLGQEIPGIPEGKAIHRRLSGAGKVGLYRSVIENAQTVLTNNPSAHPDSTGAPQWHIKLKSFLGVPFVQEGKVLGLIGVANKEGGFNEKDKVLLETITPSILEVLMRKKVEEELQKSERQALSLVKELEIADKNKDQFIGVLSHELRNPLAVISTGVQILDVTQDNNQSTMVKDIIYRQTNQLCKLVDDLLELTRISHNKIKLKKENINLNEIVKCAVEDVRLEYEKKGVKIGMKILAKPVLLNADPVRITQAVGNILTNALKFTQANGSVWPVLKIDKDYAVISVKDNGIGISPEVLPHLFTPFTQADNTLQRSGGGLGLGLSIVKGIVDLHEGSVSAFSDGVGKGSTFTIRLPIMSGDNFMKERVASGSNGTKNVKLLIVEDNKDFADLLSTMLSAAGFNASIAYDGIEGIKLAKQIKPDVIFCDIGLPGMNGYDVAKFFKADETLKNSFLVALTGYARDEDVKLAIESGFDKHIAKPVDIKLLNQVINEYTNKRRTN